MVQAISTWELFLKSRSNYPLLLFTCLIIDTINLLLHPSSGSSSSSIFIMAKYCSNVHDIRNHFVFVAKLSSMYIRRSLEMCTFSEQQLVMVLQMTL